VQHVLGARGGPQRQEAVVPVVEQPASTDRHEPGVSNFREDHRPQLEEDG